MNDGGLEQWYLSHLKNSFLCRQFHPHHHSREIMEDPLRQVNKLPSLNCLPLPPLSYHLGVLVSQLHHCTLRQWCGMIHHVGAVPCDKVLWTSIACSLAPVHKYQDSCCGPVGNSAMVTWQDVRRIWTGNGCGLTVTPHQPHRNPDRVTSVKQFLPHTSHWADEGKLPSTQWCVIGFYSETVKQEGNSQWDIWVHMRSMDSETHEG